MIPRLLLTPGEPAGIGPDITLILAKQALPAELIVIADPDLLRTRAKQLNLDIKISLAKLNEHPKLHQAHELLVLPVALKQPVQAGSLNSHNAMYVLETLKLAVSLCLQKQASGLVTGPLHKGVINQAGIAFSGHTEFFADLCGIKQTVMLFVVDQLKIALASTHLPLAKVASAITQDHLRSVINILHRELQTKFKLNHPSIALTGLNPHAGENGHLGREEIEIMTPLIEDYQRQGWQITGPHSADTLFTPNKINSHDAILAMYHDQALPVVKYIGFGHAVNMTLGLPFIRTSVDHGTALDIAGTGCADTGSLFAAIKLAAQLTLSS